MQSNTNISLYFVDVTHVNVLIITTLQAHIAFCWRSVIACMALCYGKWTPNARTRTHTHTHTHKRTHTQTHKRARTNTHNSLFYLCLYIFPSLSISPSIHPSMHASTNSCMHGLPKDAWMDGYIDRLGNG